MDLKKIFLKDACPTSIGGQAVMEGIMMRGLDRTAIAVRLPDGTIRLKTQMNKKRSSVYKIPIIRGIVAFFSSLVVGTKTLMISADMIEEYYDNEEEEEPGKFEKWFMDNFGEKALWNFLIYFSVFIAVLVSVAIFVLLPTVVIGFLSNYIESSFLLNLIEGIFRLGLFLLYIVVIANMKDIKKVFQYHGAEHKTIHCFENGLDLNPENAQTFYTLHPRCGTSFLMFVVVIAILIFSLLGWPNIWMRILSRIVLIPLIAGLSYELLKWAGRSDNIIVRILSMPGLWLQKLTTKEPSYDQLEVAICAMKAVLVSHETPCFDGLCDLDGNIVKDIETLRKEKQAEKEARLAGEGNPAILNEDNVEIQGEENDFTN